MRKADDFISNRSVRSNEQPRHAADGGVRPWAATAEANRWADKRIFANARSTA